MYPRKPVLSGRVGKKRRPSLSSQLKDLKFTPSAQDRSDVPMEYIESIPQIRTVYEIKSDMLQMRATGINTFLVDHKGDPYTISDHSINSYQLNAFIVELEEQILNLSTRLRYHTSRFSMTTRSQRRWARVGIQRQETHFMLTHQKELQDAQELLESLREEVSHMGMIEGRDVKFEKCTAVFKQRTRRRSASI